jgi:hypothetical protein
MERIGIVYILAGLIAKCFNEGKTKVNRSRFGEMLERDFPKYGVGFELTTWLTEACDLVPGAKIVREGNRIFVIKV